MPDGKPMLTFREFFEERHGKYPGTAQELMHKVVERLMNCVAEYVDYRLEGCVPKSALQPPGGAGFDLDEQEG